MSELDREAAAANKKIIASLQEMFAPLIERLTADVEPAVVYTPPAQQPEDEE